MRIHNNYIKINIKSCGLWTCIHCYDKLSQHEIPVTNNRYILTREIHFINTI